MAKDRPHPLTEGFIAEIDKRFFRPLLHYKPENMTLSEWYEHLFQAKFVEIGRFKAKAPFKMPGLLLSAPNVKIQGIGYRKVTKGNTLWVREDVRANAPVHVEWPAKRQVFEMTPGEWMWVRLHVEEA